MSRRHVLFSLLTIVLVAGALEGILAAAGAVSPRVRHVLSPPGTAQGPPAAWEPAR